MASCSRKLVKLMVAASSSSNTQKLLPHPAFILPHCSSLYSTSSKKNIPKKSQTEAPLSQSPTKKSPLKSAWGSNIDQHAEGGGSDTDLARPSEIPWQAKVANTVNLIGYVKMPVQFKTSPDGKSWAGTIITHEATSHSPLFWIPIIFDGDLAHIAACHLKENDYIYISGQLSAVNQGQSTVQVQVHSINYVQKSSSVEKKSIPQNQTECAVNKSSSVEKKSIPQNQTECAVNKSDLTCQSAEVKKHDENSVLGSWKDLVENPKEWRDNRKSKRSGVLNPKYPDFKRKDTNAPLWLNMASASVLSQLEGLEFDSQIVEVKKLKDDKWKDLIENPSKWWDNRLDKRKEKYPDFKHKETGKCLWLNDSPSWVLAKLPPPPPPPPCKT